MLLADLFGLILARLKDVHEKDQSRTNRKSASVLIAWIYYAIEFVSIVSYANTYASIEIISPKILSQCF